SLINITQTITIVQPTIPKYTELYLTYSQTVSCECQQISITYQKFLQIKYTFHQICYRIFITQDWINYFLWYNSQSTLTKNDFRFTSANRFQSLNTFCDLVNQTINNHLTQFYSNQYVTASVVPSFTFESQIDSSISQFISSMTNDFLSSLSTARQMIQSNALLTGQLTNYDLFKDSSTSYVYSFARCFGNCSCATELGTGHFFLAWAGLAGHQAPVTGQV
ncbi:unnamed protein product, partial [Adineta ricciae]